MYLIITHDVDIAINNVEMRNNESKLTSKSTKAYCCLEVNYRNLTCLQMLIYMPTQLGIRHNTTERNIISRALQKYAYKINIIKC
jgi:hypothetical protein